MSGFSNSDFNRPLDTVHRAEKDDTDSDDCVISGLIFAGTGPDLIYGNVYIKNGIIKEIEELSDSQIKSKNWIAPRFINAHTHIGDTLLKDPPLGPKIKSYAYKGDLDSLVKPPNGLKHQFLNSLSADEAVRSMESAIWEMYQNGISVFADFRERGIDGVTALMEASKNAGRDIHPVILGRPTLSPSSAGSAFASSQSFLDELDRLLEITDGIGASGANDIDSFVLTEIAKRTASKGKYLAIHAGEKNRSDIEPALALNPDLLIHMTHADKADLKAVSDSKTPIAVCVRSNLVTGVGLPPVLDMLDAGISVCIGTDNVMLNAPDIFEELHFLSKIYGITDDMLFKMAASNGAGALGCQLTGTIEVGKRADMMILNAESSNLKHVKDPLAGFIRRARADDILRIV